MKILIVEPSGKRGLCQYTHNLANALALRKHEVYLATAIGFETKCLPRKYISMEVFQRFLTHPRHLLHLFLFVKKYRPDMIHFQGALHPLFYLILWKTLKLLIHSCFIYTSHDIFPKLGQIYHQNALKQIYQGMHHIIVHARQNKEELIKYFKLNPDIISVLSVGNNMAISTDLKSDEDFCIPKAKKVILFFGTIEPHKGLMTLIRAFPKINENIDNSFLLIVGQPFEDMNPYLDEIKRLGIEGNLKLKLGHVPIEKVPGIFKVSHLVVLPYNQVSQSGVVLSAYNFGKPVVATCIGGLPEIVFDGKTGLLIPPDNPEALANAVIHLLKDDELREQMGKEAIEFVQREHSWSSIAEKTEYVYKSLLN